MDRLEQISESIRTVLEAKDTAREHALAHSRELIRHCAASVKAVHRENWDEAKEGLETVRAIARQMSEEVQAYPDLYYAGYAQDALKEYVEASVIYALVRGEPLPTPEQLDVPGETYLNGLAEAASELRRTILDTLRQEHHERAEKLLGYMDDIYDVLMTFDFPDVMTYGLRRRVDSLRGVLERTRGDLTASLQQQRLLTALRGLEQRLGLADLGAEGMQAVGDVEEGGEG